MILSTDRIRLLMHDMQKKPKERLTVFPILDWDQQAKEGQCAIDVRLGQRFTVPRRTRLAVLDHLSSHHASDISRYKDEHHVLVGDYFVLHPQQFILGETLEWIHLPREYGAYVIGRSSWGRDGLIIATATGVHSGYSGVLTLELSNLGEIPVRLYPGLRIAQLFIHTVDQVNDSEPAPSTFAGATGPTVGNAAGGDTEIIIEIAHRRGIDIK